ncbi:MAG: protein-glutamine gamma-glutamyltransferase [Caulobacteraceae bacterium]
MIRISGNVITPEGITPHYPTGSKEGKIVNKLSSDSIIYNYASLDELRFELNLRKHIIDAAVKLNKSKFSFRTFRNSICNTDYWIRTAEGGFLVREDVLPSDAVKDILINSGKYGNECATAIVIVYYEALVQIFPAEKFNSLFPRINLMGWKYLDSDLGINTVIVASDSIPGDCRYFRNPDVNPLTPWWQGENVIDLGDGLYYGHGIGIRTADGIIQVLNSLRARGATQSAYMLDSVTRLGFRHLAGKYYADDFRYWVGNVEIADKYYGTFDAKTIN